MFVDQQSKERTVVLLVTTLCLIQRIGYDETPWLLCNVLYQYARIVKLILDRTTQVLIREQIHLTL